MKANITRGEKNSVEIQINFRMLSGIDILSMNIPLAPDNVVFLFKGVFEPILHLGVSPAEVSV